MNDLGLLLVGGAVRASALAGLGVALALVLRRRGPSAVALVALTTLSGLVAVSALSLCPWPRFWTLDLAARSAPPRAVEAGRGSEPITPAGRARPPREFAAEESGSSAFAREFAREFSASSGAGSGSAGAARAGRSAEPWRWPAWVAAALIGATALATARLGIALRAVAALRRRSRPVSDAVLRGEIDALRAAMGCPRAVEARESDDLATPATVGWLRPAVLLPADWRSWQRAECRAVLAHELAHVRRGDYLWGLWAQVCLALHAYHPLAHWLVARLRLEQELAADAWGARLSGGNRPYLEALARLALRRAGPLEASANRAAWPARPFLPTRGTLLRRIEMLRDAQPRLTTPFPPLGRALTVAALAAAALLVAGLRGPVTTRALAQQAGDKPETRRGHLDIKGVRHQGQHADPFDVSRAPRETSVVVVGRPAEIFKNPAFKPVADALNALDRPGAAKVEDSKFKVEDVETVALYVLAVPLAPDRPPALQQVFTIRTTGPDAAKALVQRNVPDPIEFQHEGQTYVRSKKDPGSVLSTPDDRTVILGGEGALRRVLAARVGAAVRHNWDAAWSKVNKGRLAVAVDTAFLASMVPPPRAAADGRPMTPADAFAATLAPFAPLLEKTTAYAVGLDLKDGLSVDALAYCATEQGAVQVAETVGAIKTLAKNALPGLRGWNDAVLLGHREVLELTDGLLANARELRGDDRRVVEYRSRTDADVAGLLRSAIPAVTAARAAARRSQTTNNIKQIGLAMHNYHSSNGHLPPPAVRSPGGKVAHSWRVALLPYIDQNDLYKQYDFNEPWDGPKNRKLLDKMPAFYRSPNDAPNSTRSSYFVLVGPDTAFPPTGPGVRVADITDGTANTILVVEAKRDIPWTKPEDIPYDAAKPLPELGGFTPGGFATGFCDDSAHFLSNQVAESTLRAVITRAGGEVVSADVLHPGETPQNPRRAFSPPPGVGPTPPPGFRTAPLPPPLGTRPAPPPAGNAPDPRRR